MRSVLVPGGRTRSWPTTSIEKLNGGKTKVRVMSSPLSPRPRRVRSSVFSKVVRLICSVPLPNMKMPSGSSALKFVSRVMTPQNCGALLSSPELSSTNLPAVAPTVPSLMIESSPLKDSEKTLRTLSISMVASALTSNNGSSKMPALSRMMPPDSSMKNDEAWVMMMTESVVSPPELP